MTRKRITGNPVTEHPLLGHAAIVIVGIVSRRFGWRLHPPSISPLSICGIVAAVLSIFAARLVKFSYEKGERLVPLTFVVIIEMIAFFVFKLTEIEREDLVFFPSMSAKVG